MSFVIENGVLKEYYGYDSDIVIPDSVTSIGDDAFYKCSSLTSVTIGNSVTSIGESAFKNCKSLTSVTIGNSVTSIGKNAFKNCKSLTSVTIGNSVTSIGECAFYECESLTSVTIPDSVTSIGNYAFAYCESLTSVTIPDSVTSIGERAFYWCTSLTSVTIGNSVTSIGERAFSGCSSLTSVTIPDSVTSIGEGAFEDCRSLTSVTMGNNVTNIGNDAFSNTPWFENYSDDFDDFVIFGKVLIKYKGHDKVVTIPDKIEKICENTFHECRSLKSVRIPANVAAICLDCHYQIDYGNRVYDDGAFSGCENLELIEVSPDNATFADVDGVLYDKELKTLLKCPPAKTGVTIPEDVEKIKEWAFYQCEDIASIVIPEKVTEIGTGAFENCSALTSIIVPDSVVSIENQAFYGCSSLETVVIGMNCEKIGEFAFRHCTALKTVIMSGTNVLQISGDAFSNCKSLETMFIKNIKIDYTVIAKEKRDILGDVLAMINGEDYTKTMPLAVKYSILCKMFCADYHSEAFNAYFKKNFSKIFKSALNVGNAEFFKKVSKNEKLFTKRIQNSIDIESIISSRIPVANKYEIVCVLFCMNYDNEIFNEYFKKNFSKIFQYMIDNDDVETVAAIINSGKFLTKRNIDKFIQYAIDNRHIEIQVLLTNYKRDKIGYSDPFQKLKL